MKKKILIGFVCFCVVAIKAQVPADSLTGTYVGKFWYANPSSGPWTITDDTLYITSIDSTNCIWQGHSLNFSCGCVPPAANYYTDYFSCNSTAPTNFYTKFYSGDSVRVIYNNLPQTNPNPPLSYRFYGKRISGHLPMGIEQHTVNSKQLAVYPNPASSVMQLSVNSYQLTELKVFDVFGRDVRCEIIDMRPNTAKLDMSNLPDGVYFVQVKTNEGSSTQKFMVQH